MYVYYILLLNLFKYFQLIKKQREVENISELTNKNTNKPEINEKSKNLNRNFNDLLKWKTGVDIKKDLLNRKAKENLHNPKVLKNSERILNDINPDYLKQRVEDRLLNKELCK